MAIPQPVREIVFALFEKHRAELDVTVEQYERRLRIALAESLQGRLRVYLDLRYWIFIRDAATGRKSDPKARDLLDLLRRLVKAGIIFCPASESTFYELLKQKNLDTRRATAELIDELSLGVAICDGRQRAATEFAHILHASTDPENVYPLDWLVWTKLSRVIWPYLPFHPAPDVESLQILQKSYVDYAWDRPLIEILEEMGDRVPSVSDSFDSIADKLNRGCAEHAHEIRSFDHAYVTEVAGIISLYTEEIVRILEEKYRRQTGKLASLTNAQRAENEKLSLRFFVNALRVGKLRKELPTLHVQSICHAVFRRDSKRKFEGNDLPDFDHAAAAIGYCDVFLTERPLQAMLMSSPMTPDKELECEIISNMQDAIVYLQKYGAQENLVG